jgi:DNA polymerase I-like protein with 3'-5' exonuclease and polymerase domains
MARKNNSIVPAGGAIPDVIIKPGLPPVAKKGQLVTLDFEMFDQPKNKLHRPTGRFALISVKLQDDPVVYQIYDEKDLRKLVKVTNAGTWVFHNALYDLRQFRRYAAIKPRFVWDTMLLEQAMRGGLYQNYGLADLVRRWLGKQMEKETREHFAEGRELSPQMKNYAALDVINTEAVILQQIETYTKEAGFAAYKYADEPMIFPMLDLQGFRVDVAGWEAMVREFERRGREIEEELGFNVYSRAQVIANVQKKARIKLQDTTKETLAEFAGNPIIDAIIEARMYRKAASTYGMKWLEENVESDGKVYSDYHITGATTTGRMSSSDPNMQNIPQRRLPEYRARFLASDGHIMGVWDVAQQEPCITAYHSQDRNLINAIKNGEDLHLAVARAIYDNPNLTKADKLERGHGKAINLGLTYGLTAYGLSARTNMTVDQAEAMIRKYFMKYTGVHSYIQYQRQSAYRDGYVTTALGRRSYINPWDKKWENNAINSPIQGGAADFTKIWGRKVWERTLAAGLPPTTVAFVHDETVYDTPKQIVKEMQPIIKEAFDCTAEFLYKNIPFAVEYEYGRSWAAKSVESEMVDLDVEGGDE